MNIMKNGYSGQTVVSVDSEMAQKRILFVEGEISPEMADEFAKTVMHLVMDDEESPIHLIINSGGGEIDAGLKMCDVVSHCPCQVDAYCFTKAYSMAAILFESVNGQRYMVGNSKLMLHQPSVTGLQNKTTAQIEELSKQLVQKNDLLLSVVAERCVWNLPKLKKETLKDRYFDEKEAVRIKLADEKVSFADLMKKVKGEN